MLIKSVRGFTPKYGKDCFFAENSTIIGEVIMGDQCSIWFQTVLRGDVNPIHLGSRVNIQDGAIIHGTYKLSSTKIGNDVSIGHNSIIHGCTINDKVLVGMGSIIMDNCIIKSNTIIAAGSVLTKNTIVQSGDIFAGVPAKKIKEINIERYSEEIKKISKNYLTYSSWYKKLNS